MELIDVTDKRTNKEFYDLARQLYKNNPNWVCPLDVELDSIFNPGANSFFKRGELIRWILRDGNEVKGRIAAFIDSKKNEGNPLPVGGIGFFECVDDPECAKFLFDCSGAWLKQRGMKAMDGPINFGENFNYWGLLVDGYNMKPSIGMQYHPPYYKKLFENYGFEVLYEQFSYRLDLTKKFPERFWKIAEWVARKPGIHFSHFSFTEKEKYTNDLAEIYNSTWHMVGTKFIPLHHTDILSFIEKMKQIIDPELVWFAYYNNKPIGMLIIIPDINEIIFRYKGNLNTINKLRLWWNLKIKNFESARIILMGIVPSFQKFGIESGIFWHLRNVMEKKKNYNNFEMSWVGSYNPKMKQLYESVGGTISKMHCTYRYVFK